LAATSPSSDDYPLVSVIIPCYQATDYVVQSIESAYAQTYPNVEVIVVDDGSTDGSYELLLRLQQSRFPTLRVVTHENHVNLGVSITRHRGLAVATGEFIALLDADDEFEPDRLEKQVAVLLRSPDVVLCHTAVSVIGDRSNADEVEAQFTCNPSRPYYIRRIKGYLRRNCICASSVLVRTKVLRRVPCAMSQVFQVEDWVCWVLLGRYGKFLLLEHKLVRYRVHSASATALVQSNRLRRQYSVLEFKLALVARSESTLHSVRCLLSAGVTIIKLLYLFIPGQASSPMSAGGQLNVVSRIAPRIADRLLGASTAVDRPAGWISSGESRANNEEQH
jgi:glycosyltransferase involved in cell wall biosynthesis